MSVVSPSRIKTSRCAISGLLRPSAASRATPQLAGRQGVRSAQTGPERGVGPLAESSSRARCARTSARQRVASSCAFRGGAGRPCQRPAHRCRTMLPQSRQGRAPVLEPGRVNRTGLPRPVPVGQSRGGRRLADCPKRPEGDAKRPPRSKILSERRLCGRRLDCSPVFPERIKRERGLSNATPRATASDWHSDSVPVSAGQQVTEALPCPALSQPQPPPSRQEHGSPAEGR